MTEAEAKREGPWRGAVWTILVLGLLAAAGGLLAAEGIATMAVVGEGSLACVGGIPIAPAWRIVFIGGVVSWLLSVATGIWSILYRGQGKSVFLLAVMVPIAVIAIGFFVLSRTASTTCDRQGAAREYAFDLNLAPLCGEEKVSTQSYGGENQDGVHSWRKLPIQVGSRK